MKSRVQTLLFVWVGIGALSVVVLQAAPVQGLPLAPMATPTLIPVGTANKTWVPIQRVDAVGVVQVYVPAGCFMMGNDSMDSLSGHRSERPAREVCLTQPFWIDLFEVTNESYQKFMDAGGYGTRMYWSAAGWQWKGMKTEPKAFGFGFKPPQEPSLGVTWYEAEAYAAWRGCRLPTEAEWEYAGRGPESWIYPWGNEFIADHVVFWDTATFYKEGGRWVANVGSRPAGASWVGALDMSGNISEWVVDWYEWYDVNSPRNDPVGPSTGDSRVARGGNFHSASYQIYLSRRMAWPPDSQIYYNGFRVVCSAQTP